MGNNIMDNLGISMDTLGEDSSIKKLYDEFHSRKNALKGSIEKDETTQSVVRKEMTKQISETDEYVSLLDSVREVIFNALSESPEFSVCLFDDLQDLKREIDNVRDYATRKFLKENAPKSSKKKPATNKQAKSLKAEMEQIQKAIELAIGLREMQGNTSKVAGIEYKKSGKVSVDMPKGRQTSSDNGNAGRYAKVSKLHFVWYPKNEEGTVLNGEEIPSEMTPADVAYHYVSDLKNGTFYKWAAIAEMVKESGQEMFKNWNLEFENGVLEATNTEIEEEDSDQ